MAQIFRVTARLENAVYSVTDASNLDRNLITQNPPSPTPTSARPSSAVGACSPVISSITICRSVVLNTATNPVQCGVIVSFKYPFQFYLPFTSSTCKQITLAAQAQSRMETKCAA